METNPFPSALINDWSFLEEITSRQPCPKCKKSRKFFCYTCYIALPEIKDILPCVKLPIKVDIIKHPSELDGKSTSTHAAILAPDDVTIYIYPQIPDYKNEKVALVFPCKDALTLDCFVMKDRNSFQKEKDNNIFKSCSIEERTQNDFEESSTSLSEASHQYNETETQNAHINFNEKKTVTDSECYFTVENNGAQIKKYCSNKRKVICTIDSQEPCNSEEKPEKIFKSAKEDFPFERVIFIDSTWNQTSLIINDERLGDFPRVELKSRHTNFWRKQQGIPNTYLSTIEAIYYFIKDFHTTFIDPSYNNEYDNLLFFFCFMYNKIIVNSSGSKSIMEKSSS